MTTQQWAALLRQAVALSGMTMTALAEQIPMAPSAMYRLAKGRTFPSVRVADALARILDAPYLAEAMLEARKKTCVVCGAIFVDRGTKRNALSCGTPCNRVIRARRDRGIRDSSNAYAAMVARRRLAAYSAAVVAFCRSCEPEGICRSGSCELRTVSPLPLSERRTA